MRTARLRGLSEDGQSLIVETGDGEPIAILADAQLRKALRDVRPRPQLEIEMESGMTPREIQMKIRAGASVEDLVEASGMPVSRVEAFAAPVMAEREHIAGQAQLGSVRRSGESAAHRTLRNALAERLREHAADPESVAWDSYKQQDGRWSVTARYGVADESREAVFTYDNRGRFSVADNDEARWVLGESTGAGLATAAPQAVSDPDGDTEPTVKLHGDAEELALIRAVEIEEVGTSHDAPTDTADAADNQPAATTESDDSSSPARPSVTLVESDDSTDGEGPDDQVDEAANTTDGEDPASAGAEVDHGGSAPEVETESQLDLLYDLLGSDGYAEESTRIYDGLSDATAVPDVGDRGWRAAPDEPATTDVADPDDSDEIASESESADLGGTTSAEPVAESPEAVEESVADDRIDEPSDADRGFAEPPAVDEPESPVEPTAAADEALSESSGADEEPPTDPTVTGQDSPTEPAAAEVIEPAQDALPYGDFVEPEPDAAGDREPESVVDAPPAVPGADQAALSESEQVEAADAEPPAIETDQAEPEPGSKSAPKKSKKRKRASVPSWDEIMFGSPKSK